MTTADKFWIPDTLVIILTRNRPKALRRCVDIALQSTGVADTLVILDDSDERYMQENCTILAKKRVPRETPIVYIPTGELLKLLNKYLPTSALEWTRKMAKRDIAPIRNASLILSRCFEAGHVLLIDDDIEGFDISVTRYWATLLAQKYGSVVVGAHIGGLDETDVISRVARGIKRICICTNAEYPMMSVRESFTITPIADEIHCKSEIVSGGYLSFKFTSSTPEPFPPGYNEDWLWCLSLQSKQLASVFRIPQVVIHNPSVIRKPSESDIFFELHGDMALEHELAQYRQFNQGKISRAALGCEEVCGQESEQDILPLRWVEDLLTQARAHTKECSAFIASRFRDFGLKLVERMYDEGRFQLDWKQALSSWKSDSERNRVSFCEAANSVLLTKRLGEIVERAKI